METIDGATVSPAHAALYLEAASIGSSSNIFTGYAPAAYEPKSHHASDDDEDAEMSDGGFHIDMGSAHSQQPNTETDMVDADVMSLYNVAVITTSSTFHTSLLHDDNGSEDFTEYIPGEDTAESDYDIADDDEVDDEDENEVENSGFVPQTTLISDPMSAVSQQLQNLQDEQEEDEFATSAAMLHGSNHNHSINPFPSLPPISELFSDQVSLPVLHDAPSAEYPSSATTAASGSLLGVHIEGQGLDLDQISSDVDWGGYGDPDGESDEEGVTNANTLQVDDAHALDLRNFLYAWVQWSTNQKSKSKKKRKKECVPNVAYLDLLSEELPMETCRSDLHGDVCDFQGLDWTKIEVGRKEARKMRLRTYKNYTNLKIPVWHNLNLRRSIIEDQGNYFKFCRMDFRPKIGLSHFQLRNLLACTSRNNICYAGESKVYTINPLFDQKVIKMDLTDPVVQTANPFILPGIQISTIAADHNVLVAGGFCGEYGMVALDSPPRTDHTEGLITTDMNPITNHVQIHLNRHSGLPLAVFASNDTFVRTLDCTTNKIIALHKYDYAVNCSAISPDHRLRVIVGDNRNVIICDAERGSVLQDLSGHMDYGFACAWADNGWHVATGNQDKLVKIWDARMWTDHQGLGKPIETIACTITGARSLKYSPLGSGKRLLVAAEAADMVSVIDAETYQSKQSFDFFGEVCGVDFTPDGQTLFVGIHDPIRGGIMEFEKCGSGGVYRPKDPYDQSQERRDESNGMGFDERPSGLDWRRTDAEVVDDPRSRRTATHRQRKAAQSWDMGPF